MGICACLVFITINVITSLNVLCESYVCLCLMLHRLIFAGHNTLYYSLMIGVVNKIMSKILNF